MRQTSFELSFFTGGVPLEIHSWQPDLVLAAVGAWPVWEDGRAGEIPEEAADPSALEGAFRLTVPSLVALSLVACRPQQKHACFVLPAVGFVCVSAEVSLSSVEVRNMQKHSSSANRSVILCVCYTLKFLCVAHFRMLVSLSMLRGR